MLRVIALAVVAAGFAGAALGQEAVVYSNATVYTMNPLQPRAEAMAVRGEFLVAVGTLENVRAQAGADAKEVDLGGKTVLPGLIDSHGHMASLGAFGLGVLELSAAADFGAVVKAAAEAAEKKGAGEWVLGGRWDHESWPGKELPTHGELSKATPENPVWLRRVDGHAGIANAAALELAGITRDTPNPEGGEILRDASGEPTGVLVDNAMRLVEAKVPAGARGKGEDLLLKAQELCLSAGLTGVHDAGVSPGDVAVYEKLAAEGRLKLRCYLMMSAPYAMKWFEERQPFSGPVVTVRAAKLYMDGAMGSRGAWLLEPYADRAEDAEGNPYTGLAVSKPELIEAVARHAVEKGYQVCTHAIGDRANREVLDAYERATKIVGIPPAKMNYRFRIEHAQLLNLDDMPRFAELGVVASMQPTHCTSDMRWVEQRVGAERARGAYAWQNLLVQGVVIAGGSDFPVESHNPFLGLYAAVTRQDRSGQPEGGWMPQEKMTREQALHAFTMGGAYASFEEGTRGSLEAGKLADFIVVDRDIMTCPEIEIDDARVLRTVIGGETVYELKEESAPAP
jgi:predicted amidohydrolase YtcJ